MHRVLIIQHHNMLLAVRLIDRSSGAVGGLRTLNHNILIGLLTLNDDKTHLAMHSVLIIQHHNVFLSLLFIDGRGGAVGGLGGLCRGLLLWKDYFS